MAFGKKLEGDGDNPIYSGVNSHLTLNPIDGTASMNAVDYIYREKPNLENVEARIQERTIAGKRFRAKTEQDQHDKTIIGNLKRRGYNDHTGYINLLGLDHDYGVHDLTSDCYYTNKSGEKVLDATLFLDKLDEVAGKINMDFSHGIIDETQYTQYMHGMNYVTNQALQYVDPEYLHANLSNSYLQRNLKKKA